MMREDSIIQVNLSYNESSSHMIILLFSIYFETLTFRTFRDQSY